MPTWPQNTLAARVLEVWLSRVTAGNSVRVQLGQSIKKADIVGKGAENKGKSSTGAVHLFVESASL